MLHRDFRVLRRQFIAFLLRTVINPFLFVFIFVYLLPKIGQGISIGGSEFGTVILPGLIAVGMVAQGFAAVTLPLATEFGRTHEIYDRIMTPLPVPFVAIEKIIFSTAQSVLSAIIVFPVAYYIPSTPVQAHVSSWTLLVTVILLSGIVSALIGLVFGTAVDAPNIGLVYFVILVPMTFFGCVYYPWALLHKIRWLQIAVLLNPLVYMSEGLRMALTPQLPHMPVWLIILAPTAEILILGRIGISGFLRRVRI